MVLPTVSILKSSNFAEISLFSIHPKIHSVPLLKYEVCSLTSSFPPRHHSLLILHFICCHSTPLLFLQSLQLHLTYLHYYVNRYILKQSVLISQLDCTRASFFSPGPRYVLSESCCSIYLVSFPLVLVTLKYICLFISNHCISISSPLCVVIQSHLSLLCWKELCYDSMLEVLSKELTLVLSDTRELDRVPNTKQSTLYTIPHGPC